MADPILTEAVEPIGQRQARGFIDYADGRGEFGEWTEPVFPPYPEGRSFRNHRVARSISLRQAADLLGLTAVELSAAERGRRHFCKGSYEAALLRLEEKP